MLLSLLNATRDESKILDLYSARIDTMELKQAGVDRWGTDTSTFTRILCLRNFDQIRLISQEYEYVSGNTLDKDLKKEFSGDLLDAFLAIYRYANDRAEYFARCFHKAIIGFGTNDRQVVRLCVTRSEIDMIEIKEAYELKYGKTLKSAIKGDTSGYYRKTLLKLIGEK
jgi:annexin A7/11